MSEDCQGTITQEDGGIDVRTSVIACGLCEESDCHGKLGITMEGPAENETPSEVTKEIPIPEKDKLSNILLKSLGEKYAEVVLGIISGKITGFTIITNGPNGIGERGMIGERAREQALTHIALNDLEKKMANLTAQPKGWIDRLLKEVLN